MYNNASQNDVFWDKSKQSWLLKRKTQRNYKGGARNTKELEINFQENKDKRVSLCFVQTRTALYDWLL